MQFSYITKYSSSFDFFQHFKNAKTHRLCRNSGTDLARHRIKRWKVNYSYSIWFSPYCYSVFFSTLSDGETAYKVDPHLWLSQNLGGVLRGTEGEFPQYKFVSLLQNPSPQHYQVLSLTEKVITTRYCNSWQGIRQSIVQNSKKPPNQLINRAFVIKITKFLNKST